MSDLKPCPICAGPAHRGTYDIWCAGVKFNRHTMIVMLEDEWNTRAPVSVQKAAKVLLNDRAALDRMVYVAEDIHCTGVSFNRVVGDALRAIAEGGEA